jgi:hypothetical protein
MALILKNFSMNELLTVAAVLLAILLPCAYSLNKDEFPSDFVFGVSTSAYQVCSSLFFFSIPNVMLLHFLYIHV